MYNSDVFTMGMSVTLWYISRALGTRDIVLQCTVPLFTPIL